MKVRARPRLLERLIIVLVLLVALTTAGCTPYAARTAIGIGMLVGAAALMADDSIVYYEEPEGSCSHPQRYRSRGWSYDVHGCWRCTGLGR